MGRSASHADHAQTMLRGVAPRIRYAVEMLMLIGRFPLHVRVARHCPTCQLDGQSARDPRAKPLVSMGPLPWPFRVVQPVSAALVVAWVVHDADLQVRLVARHTSRERPLPLTISQTAVPLTRNSARADSI